MAGHYTSNEKTFIKNLGLNIYAKTSVGVKEKGRVGMLETYLRAAKRRQKWGKIDREECIEYARQQLSAAKGGK